MKKQTIISLLILFSAIPAYSQFNLKNLELEVGPSAVLASTKKGGSLEVGMALFGELRYNFDNLPVDFGVHYSLGEFRRVWVPVPHGSYTASNFRDYLLVGNYNFRQHKKVSPFIGLGFGYSFHTLRHEKSRYPGADTFVIEEKSNSYCIMPRVGLEFFKVFRLSVSYKLSESYFSNFECSLGVVLGGWKKK